LAGEDQTPISGSGYYPDPRGYVEPSNSNEFKMNGDRSKN